MLGAIVMVGVQQVHGANAGPIIDDRNIDDGAEPHAFDQRMVEEGPANALLVTAEIGFATFEHELTPRRVTHRFSA